jgi:6-phosphogluconolactonase (cycloisomerase 2 family)
MRTSVRRTGAASVTVAAALCTLGTAALASPASADEHHSVRTGAVFVQTDSPTGNTVVAYRRAADGTLTEAGRYATGGLGGVLSGSVVDHLASQGSLTLDRRHHALYAVNAGSDTLTVFGVAGDRLRRRDVVPSGGSFPVSVAAHGDRVYVLNARAGGTVQGFRRTGHGLVAIPGSNRALGLDPTATPEFVNTPGQVAFSPDGSQLLVTTKANGNDVDVFRVQRSGSLSATPTVNSLPGAVPFAMSFDRLGRLVLAEAGTNSVATFRVDGAGDLHAISSAATGQAATCWIVRNGDRFYASNAGSATLSGYRVGSSGGLTPLGTTATDPGTVDATVSSNGSHLYVQAGAAGQVDAFRIGRDGTLTLLGSITVPDAVGGEGIAAD